jgi:hypothetical protein
MVCGSRSVCPTRLDRTRALTPYSFCLSSTCPRTHAHAQGVLTSEEIDEKKLIDQHYYSIASKATILTPDQLNIPEDKFQEAFGISWKDALASGRVFNALDGCKELGITADEMDKAWGAAKKAGNLVKFGGGFYCGKVEIEGKEPCYIFNGFFMSMRSKFTAPGLTIHYYVVEWDSDALAWSDFRGKVRMSSACAPPPLHPLLPFTKVIVLSSLQC